MCEFTKLMKGTKYEKKEPELTYEMMVQLAVVQEEEADPRNIPMNIGGDPLTEWIDGHKLDDLGVMPGTDESKWKEVPVFTTDKDGYVYVDIIKDKE